MILRLEETGTSFQDIREMCRIAKLLTVEVVATISGKTVCASWNDDPHKVYGKYFTQ